MVEFSRNEDQWQIVLRPNRAFTWRQNRLFLLLMAGIYLLFSTIGLFFGLWPILFFSGLDIALLFFAFWWVARKNQQQIVLRKDGDFLVIESGRFRPEYTARFLLTWASLVGVPDTRENGWAAIRLGQSGQLVDIGHFLNQPDRNKLWQLLLSLGLRGRTSE